MRSVKQWFLRITAAVLVLALFLTAFTFNLSSVSTDTDAYSDKARKLASLQLMLEDGYAGGTRAQRMAAVIKQLLSGCETYDDYEMAFQIAIAQRDYADALTFMQGCIDTYRGNSEDLGMLYLRLGYLYILTDDGSSALTALNTGLSLRQEPEAYLTRAQLLLQLGDAEGALADARTYTQTAQEFDSTLPDLVNVFEAAGDYTTAISYYNILLDSEVFYNKDYYLNRAHCYASAGLLRAAEEDVAAYEKAGGEEVSLARLLLGSGYMGQGDYEKAKESFLLAAQAGGDEQTVSYYIALCAYKTGDYEVSAAYGDKIVNRILRGTYEGTAEVAVSADGKLTVNLSKPNTEALCLMTGASHYRLNDSEETLNSLSACLELEGVDVYVHYLRGTFRMEAAQYEEAIADFNTSISAGENVEKCRMNRGLCYYEIGQRELARADFAYVAENGLTKAQTAREILSLMDETDAQTAENREAE